MARMSHTKTCTCVQHLSFNNVLTRKILTNIGLSLLRLALEGGWIYLIVFLLSLCQYLFVRAYAGDDVQK